MIFTKMLIITVSVQLDNLMYLHWCIFLKWVYSFHHSLQDICDHPSIKIYFSWQTLISRQLVFCLYLEKNYTDPNLLAVADANRFPFNVLFPSLKGNHYLTPLSILRPHTHFFPFTNHPQVSSSSLF